jgi:hypothetical protein
MYTQSIISELIDAPLCQDEAPLRIYNHERERRDRNVGTRIVNFCLGDYSTGFSKFLQAVEIETLSDIHQLSSHEINSLIG